MGNEFKYERYFRIVTAQGDQLHTVGVGIEEYDASDYSFDNVLYIASIYLDDGGRSKAIKHAIEIIETQISEGERAVIRINGKSWQQWRAIYTRHKITNLKIRRSGWCLMLANDAVKRKTNISERL